VVGNNRLLTCRAFNNEVYDSLGELPVLPNAAPETHEYPVTHHPEHQDKAVTTHFLAPYCPIDDEPGRDLAVPPA
jgi:hypothetical protein